MRRSCVYANTIHTELELRTPMGGWCCIHSAKTTCVLKGNPRRKGDVKICYDLAVYANTLHTK